MLYGTVPSDHAQGRIGSVSISTHIFCEGVSSADPIGNILLEIDASVQRVLAIFFADTMGSPVPTIIVTTDWEGSIAGSIHPLSLLIPDLVFRNFGSIPGVQTEPFLDAFDVKISIDFEDVLDRPLERVL